MYVCAMYLTHPIAFGQYQIRFATGLYALAYLDPSLCLPLALANALSNVLFGGLGAADIVGGFFAGLFTTLGVALFRGLAVPKWFSLVPVAVIPSVMAPIWLSGLLDVPYWVLVPSILFGQLVSAFTVGVIVLKSGMLQKARAALLGIGETSGGGNLEH